MREKSNNPELLKTLGQNVKRIRLLKGLTQENLANELDKSVNFISLLENGCSGLSIQSIVDLCNALECDPNTLFVDMVPTIKNTSSLESSLQFIKGKDKEIVTNLITYILESKN